MFVCDVSTDPVRQDEAHGTAVDVEADVEAIGVDLRAVGHAEHRLEADAFLTDVAKLVLALRAPADVTHRSNVLLLQTKNVIYGHAIRMFTI